MRSILDHLWKLDCCFQTFFFLCWYFIILLIGKGVWWCGDTVSLELSTTGNFGVSCCYFFQIPPESLLPCLSLECCAAIIRKWSTTSIDFELWPWLQLPSWLCYVSWPGLLEGYCCVICIYVFACMHTCVYTSVLVYTHVSTCAHSYICVCRLLYKLVPLTCIWEVTIFNLE